MNNYPTGAANDSRAPWNEEDERLEFLVELTFEGSFIMKVTGSNESYFKPEDFHKDEVIQELKQRLEKVGVNFLIDETLETI